MQLSEAVDVILAEMYAQLEAWPDFNPRWYTYERDLSDLRKRAEVRRGEEVNDA